MAHGERGEVASDEIGIEAESRVPRNTSSAPIS